MDAVTAEVVALVIYGFSIPLAFIVSIVLFSFIGDVLGDEDGLAIGAVIGWVAGIGWAAFAVIQIILHIITLVRVLT